MTMNQVEQGQEEQMTNATEAMARSVLYNLFASILGRGLDEGWKNPHFVHKLQLGLPDVQGKGGMITSLEQAIQDADVFKALQLDYDALFLVPGPKLTFPYESCYTHRNMDGTYGRLWQEPAQDMRRILKVWNIQFAEGWDLIPDHASVELFFMAELCKRSTEASDDEVQQLMDWQRNFFESHLNSWIFEFLGNVQKKADTGFYQSAVRLLVAFLEEEKVALLTN